MNKRYLSGIQPSGDLHLGNYLGAIRQHVAAQDNAFYFIADYHALTTVNDPATLRSQTLQAAATYLAFGLDPERATLFRQSDIPEVTELTWLLATTAGKGLLDRAVSYKDKVNRGLQAGLGLYLYPVLMAADILAYESDVVPVGSDQVQHVEMCRDMAAAYNACYGEVFKLPVAEVGTPVPVPGLDGQKMSKSYGNTIPLFAMSAELRQRVMSIVTTSAPLEEPKDPETCTVFQLYRLIATEEEAAQMAERYRAGGYGYGSAKTALLKRIEETFAPARQKYAALLARPEEVEEALRAGGARARKIAREVVGRARAACGL
jgi:tryptophanyl-tRNA synthetase